MDGKLLALITAACFGLNPVVLRLGFTRAPGSVDAAVTIGLAIALPLYLAIVPFTGGLHWERMTGTALVAFAFGGLFGGGIGRRWMYTAIDRIGAAPATAIKNSAPLFSTLFAVPLLGERVGAKEWASIVMIVAGIWLLTWRPAGAKKVRTLLDVGVIAAIGSALSYGIRPLILKFGLTEVNLPITAAVVAAFSALGYALLLSRPWTWTWLRAPLPGSGPRIGTPAITLFIAAGLLQTAGLLSLIFAVSDDAVTRVYPVTAAAPLFTVAFTLLLLRGTERINARVLFAVCAIVTGVIIL